MGRSSTGRSGQTTVSVVVLAYNEAKNLPAAISSIREAIEGRFAAYEIIIVDDGSRDETGQVADEIAAGDDRVVAVHNPQNMGCGYTFRRGVRQARYEYVWLVPGDGEIGREAMIAIAQRAGTADMIIPYVTNFNSRPLDRRIVSWGYTTLINILFWKRLRYYNGPCIIRTAPAKEVPAVNSRGFAFMAPILLRLMKRGCSYVEVGIQLQPRLHGKPSVGSMLNIFSALRTILWLFPDIHFREKNTASGDSKGCISEAKRSDADA